MQNVWPHLHRLRKNKNLGSLWILNLLLYESMCTKSWTDYFFFFLKQKKPKEISLVMSCSTHTCHHSVCCGAAAYIQLQWLYHWCLIRSRWAHRGRGDSLLPLCQTGRGDASVGLQEGTLQFADVGLVLDDLRRRLCVLKWPINRDTMMRAGAARRERRPCFMYAMVACISKELPKIRGQHKMQLGKDLRRKLPQT